MPVYFVEHQVWKFGVKSHNFGIHMKFHLVVYIVHFRSKRIFATSVLVFTRRTDLSSFQRSHWSPIHILLLPNLAFDSLFRCFLSESVNLLFGPRFELDSDMFLSLTTISIRSYEYGKFSWNSGGNYCMRGHNSRYLFPPLFYSNASWKTNFIAFFKCFKQV